MKRTAISKFGHMLAGGCLLCLSIPALSFSHPTPPPMNRPLCLFVILIAGCFHAPAQIKPLLPLGSFEQKSGPEVTAQLMADVESISPGATFTVAIKFEPQDGWIYYWKNTGGIQLAPSVKWKLPPGFKASELMFAVPEVFKEGGFLVYGYHGESYVLAQITAPEDLPTSGETSLSLSATYQFCKEDQCKMEADKLLTLKLSHASAVKAHGVNGPLLEAYRKSNLPKSGEGWKATAYRAARNFIIAIEPPTGTAAADKVQFLTEQPEITDGQKQQKFANKEGKWSLTVPMNNELKPDALPKSITGLLLLGEGDKREGINLNVPISSDPVPEGFGEPSESLLLLLWFGFIGGLILNLMPCVFPVIGIKIMDFVKQSGQESWRVKVHGLIFSAGILITFWLLAGLFLFLRSQGEQVGWGFQLQNPWVVYVLMLVMFIFALNMYGVFEIGTSAVGVGQGLVGRKGFMGSFFKGALAVVVSTPCSAPFLATALSAVISLPAAKMFLVFTSIAVGLAAPYLILTASPALLKLLPKPGAWMEGFKQIMSFLMFGTAGFLLWIYGGLINESNMLYAIIGLTAVGMALYIHGKWNTPVSERSTRSKAIPIAAILLIAGLYFGRPIIDPLKWEPWSKERQQSLVDEGVPVYIDFTARWCATCQTNKISYKSEDIVQEVEQKGIVLLKADWTDHNESIRAELESSYGKAAVPVNVLLIPGKTEPEILPNILTTGIVLDYFRKLPAKDE